MRPWTVICSEEGSLRALDVSAPYDYEAAEEHIQKICTGIILAIIPGQHANKTSVFNQEKN